MTIYSFYSSLIQRVEKVRYIGVNAPEVHHPKRGEEPGGREAWDVNRQLRLFLDLQRDAWEAGRGLWRRA